MVKRVVGMLAPIAVIASLIFIYRNSDIEANGKALGLPSAPAQRVSAIVAQYQEWSLQIHAVGTVEAARGVEISSQIPGTVAAIDFESGAHVKTGDLLVELVAAEDMAKLQALLATAALSKVTYERNMRILQVQSVSQQAVDTSREIMRRDEALAEQQRAIMELKSIRAPFSGELGIRRVNLGQYLEAGMPMVTLQDLDTVYLDFYVPQQTIGRIKVGKRVVARIDAFPEREFSGRIDALNKKVDSNSRNIQVRAILPNSDHALVPGMFAALEVSTGAVARRIAVPQTAVCYHPYGNTVFTVERGQDKGEGRGLVAREVSVVTGESHGDQIDLLSGVKEGQTVVTSGGNTLVDGVAIVVDNSLDLSVDPQPVPADY